MNTSPKHFWPEMSVTGKNDPKCFSIHINRSFNPKIKKLTEAWKNSLFFVFSFCFFWSTLISHGKFQQTGNIAENALKEFYQFHSQSRLCAKLLLLKISCTINQGIIIMLTWKIPTNQINRKCCWFCFQTTLKEFYQFHSRSRLCAKLWRSPAP